MIITYKFGQVYRHIVFINNVKKRIDFELIRWHLYQILFEHFHSIVLHLHLFLCLDTLHIE